MTAFRLRSGGSLQRNSTQEIPSACKEYTKPLESDNEAELRRRVTNRKRVDSLPCLHLQQPCAPLDRLAAVDRDERSRAKSKKGYRYNQSRSACDILTLVIHDSKKTYSNGIANKEWILATMPGSENKNQVDGKKKVNAVRMYVFHKTLHVCQLTYFC